mmetsp:Transcript_6992/g.9294  ORF Transcript_6992/g.9294 Transcript_6992/m.9294 type:complete len:87 (+) Transcript_6992:218-478(+)
MYQIAAVDFSTSQNGVESGATPQFHSTNAYYTVPFHRYPTIATPSFFFNECCISHTTARQIHSDQYGMDTVSCYELSIKGMAENIC